MPMPHSRPGRSRVAVVQLGEQLVDALEACLRAGGDVGRLVTMAEDAAVEVGDGDVDARRAEVGDEHVAGVRAERHLARRAAAGARANVIVDDEPELDQLGHALGDDAATQARARHQLGPRTRPCLPDLVEDRDERIERLRPRHPTVFSRFTSPDHTRSVATFCT